MRKWMISTVLGLAISSGIVALIILLVPLGESASELASRGQLSAAVSTTFALIAGVIAIIVTTMVSSSDYQAEQAVKADTARILAALRSIMMKGAWISYNSSKKQSILDFTQEKQVINTFLSSTTAFAYWSWVGEKSELAGKGKREEWRVFFLSLVTLLDTEENRELISIATNLEKIIANLQPQDVRRISSYLNDLANAVNDFERSADNDPMINAIRQLYKRTDPETIRRMLLHIKSKGVQDPNLDLILAVSDDGSNEKDNLDIVKKALSLGADPNISTGELFNTYKNELKDFDTGNQGE